MLQFHFFSPTPWGALCNLNSSLKSRFFVLLLLPDRLKLESTLGIINNTQAVSDLSLDRNSDASLESKLGAIQAEGAAVAAQNAAETAGSAPAVAAAAGAADLKQIKELNEEKRRSARRKE